MGDVVWSKDEEYFNDESLQDLLDGGDFDVGDTVYFGTKSTPSSEWIGANDVVEMIGNIAYDNHGEFAEDFPNTTADAIQELQDFLLQWQKKNCVANFYSVYDSEKYILTEKDFSN